MNKTLLNEMLELARREKARYEKIIRELNEELRADGQPAKKKKQEEDSKTAKTEKEIIQVLNSLDEYVGPKRIVELGRELGIQLEPNMVRSILSRGKDSTFVSPERGKWTTKEKAKELEQAKENATA